MKKHRFQDVETEVIPPPRVLTVRHTQYFMYLKEEWTLALGLWAGRPEPVRKSVRLRRRDVVAQSKGLLLQLLWGIVPGQQALSLALQTRRRPEKNYNHVQLIFLRTTSTF